MQERAWLLDRAGQQVGWQRRLCHLMLVSALTLHAGWEANETSTLLGIPHQVRISHQVGWYLVSVGRRPRGESARTFWCDNDDGTMMDTIGYGLQIRRLNF